MSERRSLPVLLYPCVGFMSMWSDGSRITTEVHAVPVALFILLTISLNFSKTRFIQHVEGITINIFKNLNFGVFVRVCVCGERERGGERGRERESVCVCVYHCVCMGETDRQTNRQ